MMFLNVSRRLCKKLKKIFSLGRNDKVLGGRCVAFILFLLSHPDVSNEFRRSIELYDKDRFGAFYYSFGGEYLL